MAQEAVLGPPKAAVQAQAEAQAAAQEPAVAQETAVAQAQLCHLWALLL